MNVLLNVIYVAIVWAIRAYKWIELQILLLFTPWLNRKGAEILGNIGVVLHYSGEKDPQLPPNSKSKYDRILHLKVNDPKWAAWAANTGTLGAGQAYMHKLTDICDTTYEEFAELVTRIFENNLLDLYYNPWNKFLEWLELYAFNLQSGAKVFEVGQQHYDLGNDLYELMLDPWMQYTCAYWKDAKNLDEAQINKLELISKKLDLKPGMRVLDIGCGFGMLAKYLAQNYSVECVGITISVEQAKYGNKLCEGLPVEIRVQDYRDVTEKFDRVVSIGCLEHIGCKNYRKFIEVAHRCLKDDDGIFLMHSIGRNHKNRNASDPWSHKYIFPNGMVPSVKQVAEMTEGLFIIEDWHNFSLDYAKTLVAWRENFLNAWPKLEKTYGKGFFRMRICYLCSAQAFFKSRRFQLWQVVMSKDGLKREYRAAR